MTDTLTRTLRAADQGVNLGADGMGWSPDPTLFRQAADEIDRLRAELAAKDERIAHIIQGNQRREAYLRSYVR